MPCPLHVGVVLRHPQGSHTLHIHELGFPNMKDWDIYAVSSSQYLPIQVGSCIGHYMDRILRIDRR